MTNKTQTTPDHPNLPRTTPTYPRLPYLPPTTPTYPRSPQPTPTTAGLWPTPTMATPYPTPYPAPYPAPYPSTDSIGPVITHGVGQGSARGRLWVITYNKGSTRR